jgi:hypothetical protein
VFHLLDLAVSGDERLTGGAFGPEASVLLTCLGAPLAAVLWWSAPSAPEDVGEQPSPEKPMV